MLTIFTVPKPMVGDTATRQWNALTSWFWLRPRPEVILIGGEDGTKSLATEFHARYEPQVERNVYGTPLVHDIFRIGERRALYQVVAYVNTDILLAQDFMRAVVACQALFPGPFLMVGQRWDIDFIPDPASFAPYDPDFRLEVLHNGRLHDHAGIDYFVFRAGSWGPIPPFALGRYRWDNWLLWWAVHHFPTVNVSRAVLAVHQNHDYSHAPHLDAELEANNDLVTLTGGDLYRIGDCPYYLDDHLFLHSSSEVRHVPSP